MKTLAFNNWDEFRAYVDDDSRQVCPVYWRGQRDPAWPLASSFERTILVLNGGWGKGSPMVHPYGDRFKGRDGKRIWEDGFYQAMRDRYLRAFQRAASGLRGPNPQDLDTDQWWALGRHYGLTTPLLDWSEKPYIATFFALSEAYREKAGPGGGIAFTGEKIAVYRLFHNPHLEGDGLRVVRPTVDELGRMQGQHGAFTWLDSEEYFELQGFVDNTGRGDLLTKVTISDQALMAGLRDLRAHGIDYRMLFPDLDGAAKHANSRWDWL